MPMPPKFAASRTRDVVQSGEDVRARVRVLTLQTLDEGLDLDQIKTVVTEVMNAAADTLKNAVPEKQSSALRGVVEGLHDAVDQTVKAASASLQEAQAKGDAFRDKTLIRNARALRRVEEEFLGALSDTAGKFSKTARAELEGLVGEARRAGHRIRPHVQQAVDAADGRLLELLGEAAGATATVARKAASMALGAASGLLQGLSERAARGKKPAKASAKPAKKPAKAAKKTAKKPAGKKKKK